MPEPGSRLKAMRCIAWAFALAAVVGQVVQATAEPRPVVENAPRTSLGEPDAGEPPPRPHDLMTFIVFFNRNSSDLTSEAMDEIGKAAAAARGHRVRVVAHCDTSEDSMDLTVRRGWAVREALGAFGYPVLDATFVYKGAAEPLVPTPQGVREPQNRRATIDILP